MAVFILKDYRGLSKKKFATLLTSITNGLYFYVLVFILPPVLKVDFTDAVDVYTKPTRLTRLGGRALKHLM